MTHDVKWRHFRGGIILWAVRWHCRYGVSCRDLEEMLEERGVAVDHTTIYRWVQATAAAMPSSPHLSVRRGKARFPSGCETHPTIVAFGW